VIFWQIANSLLQIAIASVNPTLGFF